MHYKTIIVSDIHIPSPDNKGKEFLQRLKNQTFDQLILNGDIIDGWHITLFGGWKRRHVNWRKDLIEVAGNQGVRIQYIMGNHDINIQKIAPRLSKEVDILPDIIYDNGGKKYYICHGHQFDKLEGKFTPRSKITFCGGTFLYRLNRNYNDIRKRLGLKHQSVVSSVKRRVKNLMVGGRASFQKKLVKACQKNKTQGIICGHLHKAEKIRIGRYDYMNSGDWIELCTVLVETDEGKREIVKTRK
ncbi:MAG: UDP-2,3-diacylglucosamine diphosphatase [candidate division SR1 bacterium]|nr:UDP-2,3-diacylglucosamine diphosphatase [candidate division SR1 bacterium]